MVDFGDHFSTQQLADFLALVSRYDDEAAAVHGAVEYAAEALDAEVGAVVRNGQLLASIGFPRDAVPVGPLLSAAWGNTDKVEVPGVGVCDVLAVSLEDDVPGQLLLARYKVPFERQEVNLLRGMARVLTLALQTLNVLAEERALREQSEQQAQENARLLLSLRERQRLLERLSNIQRAIVRRAKLEDVLEIVVAGVQELARSDAATLRLIDSEDDAFTTLLAVVGEATETLSNGEREPAGHGVGGLAISAEALTVVNGGDSDADERLGAGDLAAAMAAPVVENGRVVGALAVACADQAREWTATEREVLIAFAEHASLALTDSKNFGVALHRSLHDMLTSLPNRALFLDRLEHAARRSQRSGTGPAVLFLDLDGFKRVNDSLGHAAGDELLIEVAKRLSDCIRPGDTASRFGGDEFAILLEEIGEEEVALIAERVMRAVQHPFHIEDTQIRVNASVGIATPGASGEDLLRNADLAMYHAKGTGKGHFEIYDPSMHTALTERLRLETDLARAVDRDEFDVVYQPIVSLRSGAVVAVEALVRWNHPERGVLAPDAFIGAAEETGLIRAIGRSVLQKAVAAGAGWQQRHSGPVPLAISVNLSVVQLEHPALVGEVARALKSSGLEPGSLILEITETLLMHDLEGSVLGQLKDLGVQLAVDDFGTGYSSLQYLRSLPIDILKIAKPFLDGIAETGESALAQAIIDVGQSLNLRVIAEGLEQSAQVSHVIDLGCQWGQGYHFAHPQSESELEATLTARGVAGWPVESDAISARTRSRMIG